MGLIHIMERGGEDYRDYKTALKTAKRAIDALCEITEDMEEEFGERGYGERYRMGDSYEERMSERRSRDSRGRYM